MALFHIILIPWVLVTAMDANKLADASDPAAQKVLPPIRRSSARSSPGLTLESAGSSPGHTMESGVPEFIQVMPKVSVVTIGHPLRRTFKWNVLTNFLKQDYTGALELVFVDTDYYDKNLFGDRLSEMLVKESIGAPDITRGMGAVLATFQWVRSSPPKWGSHSFQSSGPRSIVHINASGHVGARRNAGMNATSGSIIANFDDDDVYDFSYVSHIVDTFSKHSDAMVVYPTKGLIHTFDIDGSMQVEGRRMGGDLAAAHAMRKATWAKCPYGNTAATEENPLLNCAKKEWPGAMKEVVKRPSNGVGYIKMKWSGGTCMRVWKNEGTKMQNDLASITGYQSYVHRILRTLHYLQEMNGGANALDALRGAFPNVTLPHIPPEDVPNGQGVRTTATCKKWDVLMELPTSNLQKSESVLQSEQLHFSMDATAATET